jgi:hypothetical protein
MIRARANAPLEKASAKALEKASAKAPIKASAKALEKEELLKAKALEKEELLQAKALAKEELLKAKALAKEELLKAKVSSKTLAKKPSKALAKVSAKALAKVSAKALAKAQPPCDLPLETIGYLKIALHFLINFDKIDPSCYNNIGNIETFVQELLRDDDSSYDYLVDIIHHLRHEATATTTVSREKQIQIHTQQIHIPASIMSPSVGYIRFAFWTLSSPGNIIQRFMLHRSLDEVIRHVTNHSSVEELNDDDDQSAVPDELDLTPFNFDDDDDDDDDTVSIFSVDYEGMQEDNVIRDDVIRDDMIRDDVIRDDMVSDNVNRDDVIRDDAISDDVIRDDAISDHMVRDHMVRDNAVNNTTLEEEEEVNHSRFIDLEIVKQLRIYNENVAGFISLLSKKRSLCADAEMSNSKKHER